MTCNDKDGTCDQKMNRTNNLLVSSLNTSGKEVSVPTRSPNVPQRKRGVNWMPVAMAAVHTKVPFAVPTMSTAVLMVQSVTSRKAVAPRNRPRPNLTLNLLKIRHIRGRLKAPI